ncbi:MAG TPA: IS200/IS605 family transposase [Thermoanaerobaculia bacterium]|nr:IS200/IS605 family transposase [Thermoanaerobaculia bacterium]
MPYWKLFYHAVWATRFRERVIVPEIEPAIYDLLRSKAVGLGATVFALNGMDDHVHLVVSVPPKLALADFVGKVKGSASARFNKSGLLDRPLYWQEEYGILSFDQKRLPRYVAYVENQKAHHARANLIPVLERMGESKKKPSSEDES